LNIHRVLPDLMEDTNINNLIKYYFDNFFDKLTEKIKITNITFDIQLTEITSKFKLILLISNINNKFCFYRVK